MARAATCNAFKGQLTIHQERLECKETFKIHPLWLSLAGPVFGHDLTNQWLS